MGILLEKPPCFICGGKISWFPPTKIGGEYICNDCSNKKQVTFTDAAEQAIDFGIIEIEAVNSSSLQTNKIEKIRKYKTLMDEGIISKEEFDSKKKILMGI